MRNAKSPGATGQGSKCFPDLLALYLTWRASRSAQIPTARLLVSLAPAVKKTLRLQFTRSALQPFYATVPVSRIALDSNRVGYRLIEVSQHDFYQFMDEIRAALASEYDRIRQRASEDPGTAGDQVEESWAELLRGWLPANYPIVTKGRLVFPDKSTSPQIDILVLTPSYPLHVRQQKHYFSGGVVAIFECKLTLKKSHIKAAFRTAATIKRRAAEFAHEGRDQNAAPYDQLVQLPIGGLLSHSHVWSSDWPSSIIYHKICECDTEFAEHPRELLDVICVADAGTFNLTKNIDIGPSIPPDIRADLHAINFKEAITTSYTIQDEHKTDNFPLDNRGHTLAALIFSLTTRIAWDDPSLRPWAEHLGSLGFFGGLCKPTFWNSEILPAPMLRKIRKGRLNDGRWSRWSRGVGI
jgi:hypothetical protein